LKACQIQEGESRQKLHHPWKITCTNFLMLEVILGGIGVSFAQAAKDSYQSKR